MLKSPLAIIMFALAFVAIVYFAVVFGFSAWTAGFLIFIAGSYIWAIILLLKDD